MMTRKEWLRWRQGGVGSSDAPIIMGVSKFKTAHQLYHDKIADDVVDEEDDFIQRRGNEIEARVRSLFEVEEGEPFPATLVESSDIPWLRASLDGLSACKKRAIEIKLLGKTDWENAKQHGVVPPQYVPQVQHALMVSGAEEIFLLGYLYSKQMPKVLDPEKLVRVRVLPDAAYQEKLLIAETQFWTCVVDKKTPGLSERDYKTLTGYTRIAKRWHKLNEKIEKLEEERDAARKDLLEAAEKSGHPRLRCAGVRLVKQSRAGNVNYKKIPELQGVDLDAYRGEPVTFWKVESE